ncbi:MULTISPECIES: glucose-1-phosphate adenylyltransferase subunit GlgD [unclassified Ruminococcus]|uniref:glucose-1-phosphate adenylyltransferase subunit GlgD n=1 Tax=unclassified Ruminococcus TaxID=2608920 RepID=UPI0021089F51|nr:MULTISPECIES: glucose-1-phosphate adenylyltransferase subunit GlgD [unclassified Ruminococcus]MCQ4022292.1 glucose-1-phosphate adenylyltransferase subunit GlgD [Ruminococcus sp. zg-924]MCQ4114620.1 glucose-1-phosphate adenylyltransferase subunit GlgD [Ruminococcus sp. zg-921]
MKGTNILGLVFPNVNDICIPELTSKRAIGSVPFGGKYRLIDFTLSNFVNYGIDNVGVVAEQKFASLMDHLGTGKAWDLSKRRGGLTLLSPYSLGNESFSTTMECMYNVKGFIEKANEEYVLISTSNTVFNFDYSKMVAQHTDTNADITFMYVHGKVSKGAIAPIIITTDTDNKITDMVINPRVGNPNEAECDYLFSSAFMKKELFLDLLVDCVSRNALDFRRNFILDNFKKLKVYGYEFTGYYSSITSLDTYFKSNMSLMDPLVRADLFNLDRPIFTKVRDDMPSKYGLGSSVKNSLVAQGCVIEGEVENCIISKGVHIGKGAKVANCIIMQDTKIGENASLSYVICDKDVVIKNERALMGYDTYPIYIAKDNIV